MVHKLCKPSRNYIVFLSDKVTIKITHVGKWFTSSTEDQNHRHRFNMTIDFSHIYLIKSHRKRTTYIKSSFWVSYVQIWHQLYTELWYRILTQVNITLNMLCPSRLHHQLFDQFHIAQYFGCETNTIVHPVTCVVSNIKTTDCLYWSPHGDSWWYISPRWIITTAKVYIKIKQGNNKLLIQWIFTKLNNSMYYTWRYKNLCITLCRTALLPKPCNYHRIK